MFRISAVGSGRTKGKIAHGREATTQGMDQVGPAVVQQFAGPRITGRVALSVFSPWFLLFVIPFCVFLYISVIVGMCAYRFS